MLEDVLPVSLVEDLRRSAMRNFDELQDILLRREATQKASTEAEAVANQSAGVTGAESKDSVSSRAESKAAERAQHRGEGMAGTMGIGIKHCYKEIVQRHAHRFEMAYKMDAREFGEAVLRCPR